MTQEQAKQLLPIIQAFAEGKQIQYKVIDDQWRDLHDTRFELNVTDYRIKPEPREFWIEILENSVLYKANAKSPHHKTYENSEVIHVREILD